MSVLERLYRLEIEFYRLFRVEAINAMEAASAHTSYALQHGYEPLLRTVGSVDSSSLTDTRDKLLGMGDPRDVQAAYHSLQNLVVH
jgi:hypothetical protein